MATPREPAPVQLTEEQRALIARDRDAAIRRRALPMPDFGAGQSTSATNASPVVIIASPVVAIGEVASSSPSGASGPTSSTAAARRRQEALHWHMASGRQAAMLMLDSVEEADDLPEEDMQQLAYVFGQLPQVVRLAIEASCNQCSVTVPLPETMRTGCLSCGDPYRAGERVITTPCIHRMHARCFFPWAGESYVASAAVGERWRLQCPECRLMLA